MTDELTIIDEIVCCSPEVEAAIEKLQKQNIKELTGRFLLKTVNDPMGDRWITALYYTDALERECVQYIPTGLLNPTEWMSGATIFDVDTEAEFMSYFKGEPPLSVERVPVPDGIN